MSLVWHGINFFYYMKKIYENLPHARFIFGIDDIAFGMIAGSLFGGVANSFGQASANYQNAQIAKDNRDWQTAEREKSQEWQEMMWNKQNEYNTPSAQLQRLRDAHINPLAGDMASSLATPLSVPNMPSAPNMPTMENTLNGVGNALQNISAANLQNAQANALNKQSVGQEIQNEIALRTKDYKVSQEFFKTCIAENETELKKLEVQYEEGTLDTRVFKLAKEAGLSNYNEALAGISLIYAPDRVLAEVKRIEAETKKLRGESQLNEQKFNINEMTKFLSEMYGVSPDANTLYNVATLLLNPVARERIASMLGILDVLSIFK